MRVDGEEKGGGVGVVVGEAEEGASGGEGGVVRRAIATRVDDGTLTGEEVVGVQVVGKSGRNRFHQTEGAVSRTIVKCVRNLRLCFANSFTEFFLSM